MVACFVASPNDSNFAIELYLSVLDLTFDMFLWILKNLWSQKWRYWALQSRRLVEKTLFFQYQNQEIPVAYGLLWKKVAVTVWCSLSRSAIILFQVSNTPILYGKLVSRVSSLFQIMPNKLFNLNQPSISFLKYYSLENTSFQVKKII